jgi:glutamate dehydrogenase
MFLLGEAKQKLNNRMEIYKNNGIAESFAYSISILDSGISTLDVLYVAHSSEIDILKISELYFKVADYFHIDWMRKCVEKNITESYWNRMSIQALKDDLYDKQRRVLQKVIDYETDKASLEKWLEYNAKYVTIFINFIEELKLQENIDLNMMILANKQFEMLLRKV